MIYYQSHFPVKKYSTVATPRKEYFERGYYIINGDVYTKYNKEFLEAFKKALVWKRLKE